MKRLDDSKERYIVSLYVCIKQPILSENPMKYFTEYQFGSFQKSFASLMNILKSSDDVQIDS